MINPIVKKHFLKNGLSEKALQGLSDSITGSLGENATDEEITAQCVVFEPFAKTFQSEIDARVAAATKKKGQEGKSGEGADEEPKPEEGKTTDPLLLAVQKLTETVQGLKTEKAVETNNQKVINGLKALKMTDKEIESVMLGRSFENEDGIEEFVTKQGEYYSEILQSRTEAAAGEGYIAPSSVGNQSQAQKKADVEAFNKEH
ncbi:hypothetical protein [Chryseobacterium aquaticum]|uniref:Uncharacterized protein n=1 Tax=Chryseobacterium aquaticum subsp. greenlandense TaxID=345663 RepID=A0A117KBS8_9FLAO|nr:hypothetical protein [Chryseobacterium aquaticum]KUJ56443.1 hypothetical protein AR686_07730 [Chryseobacterium aquaticum subsp. greenlandense]